MSSFGLTATYTTFYPEHLILGHDVYQRARHAVMAVDVDDESLALDVIAAAGPGGHYLGQRHTRTHLRGSTRFAITQVPAAGGGFRDPLEVAREEAECLYRKYVPEPLADDLRAELTRVVAAADREMRS
jgi:trimethylamine---corrinoid protein Co-methyltransferase